MSVQEYLRIPPPTPSIQAPPVMQSQPQTPPMSHSLSLNDQIKMCSMKYKITKNFAEMFNLNNLMVSPIRNMLFLQFLGLLIEKYKNEPDQAYLIRMHGLMDTAFKTTSISILAIDECVYFCNNPRVIEAIYLFTN
jgi:hypothetical protein